MDTFKLVVFTPAGKAFEEDAVRSVKLWTAVGEIGILPGHTRYIGVLGRGVMEYEAPGSSQPKRVMLTGGFANFSDGTLTVLADSIEGAIPAGSLGASAAA